jgi:putative acetyltransferase
MHKRWNTFSIVEIFPHQFTMFIQLEPPKQAEIERLIDELDAYQKPLYPPESHHGINMQALMQPHVLFAVARALNGQAVGCCAMLLEADYGEVKRMYVSPTARGQGVSRQLLQFLEGQAQLKGHTRFMLQTGNRQPQALGLYISCGYLPCGPFGLYKEDPHGVFMCKVVQQVA